MHLGIQGFIGSPRFKQDWGTSAQVATANYRIQALVCVNRNGATVWIQVYDSAAGASGVPEYEVPVAPNGTFSLTHSHFAKGVYVQAVSTPGGSVIGTNDVKITCEGTIWPVSIT